MELISESLRWLCCGRLHGDASLKGIVGKNKASVVAAVIGKSMEDRDDNRWPTSVKLALSFQTEIDSVCVPIRVFHCEPN
jgi:hypothetical protein